MVNYKKITLFLLTLTIHLSVIAQTVVPGLKPEKEEFMRSEGKIYVVMAVVITILCGLLFFVFRLDRKISKLEKG